MTVALKDLPREWQPHRPVLGFVPMDELESVLFDSDGDESVEVFVGGTMVFCNLSQLTTAEAAAYLGRVPPNTAVALSPKQLTSEAVGAALSAQGRSQLCVRGFPSVEGWAALQTLGVNSVYIFSDLYMEHGLPFDDPFVAGALRGIAFLEEPSLALVERLHAATNLRSLGFVSIHPFEELLDSVTSMHSLRSLVLSDYPQLRDGFKKLERLENLYALDLSSNKLSDQQFEQLAALRMRMLDLSRVDATPAQSAVLGTNRTITALRVAKGRISIEHLAELPLQAIDLNGTWNFGVCEQLRQWPALRAVNLTFCRDDPTSLSRLPTPLQTWFAGMPYRGPRARAPRGTNRTPNTQLVLD